MCSLDYHGGGNREGNTEEKAAQVVVDRPFAKERATRLAADQSLQAS
jgi:hypothetical protein